MRRFLSLVNKVLFANIARITDDRSMTLSLIEYKDRVATIVGQHESVIVCRRDGRVQVKDTNELGMFVGFEPDISRFIHEFKMSLESGDVMVLYTDGVTEAVNAQAEEFGLKRLCAAVGELHDKPARDILEGVLARLREHVGKARVYDDASLMVVKQR